MSELWWVQPKGYKLPKSLRVRLPYRPRKGGMNIVADPTDKDTWYYRQNLWRLLIGRHRACIDEMAVYDSEDRLLMTFNELNHPHRGFPVVLYPGDSIELPRVTINMSPSDSH